MLSLAVVLAGSFESAARGSEASDDGPGWRIVGFFHELVGYLKRSDLVGVGDPAPDFELTPLRSYRFGDFATSDAAVRLSAFKGVKPVALIFGSYT